MVFCGLLLHRPGNGVTVVLKLNPANRFQPNRTFAGVVLGEKFVCCAEVAGAVCSVVVITERKYTKMED